MHEPTTPQEFDSGAQLRSLYAPHGGTGQILSAKVADIGAGTGLLTQGLFAQGYTVAIIGWPQ